MADQTQINGSVRRNGAGAAFRENLSGLLHDVIELGELQVQLLLLDLSAAGRRTALAALLVGSALVLALGTVPVLLLAIGWTVVQFAGWTHAAAFALTGLVALVLAAGLAWFAWRRLNAAISKLSRSREEFATNVRWIKDALKQNTSPSRRSRTGRATSDVSQQRTTLP
jgi:hypothetical protein